MGPGQVRRLHEVALPPSPPTPSCPASSGETPAVAGGVTQPGHDPARPGPARSTGSPGLGGMSPGSRRIPARPLGRSGLCRARVQNKQRRTKGTGEAGPPPGAPLPARVWVWRGRSGSLFLRFCGLPAGSRREPAAGRQHRDLRSTRAAAARSLVSACLSFPTSNRRRWRGTPPPPPWLRGRQFLGESRGRGPRGERMEVDTRGLRLGCPR